MGSAELALMFRISRALMLSIGLAATGCSGADITAGDTGSSSTSAASTSTSDTPAPTTTGDASTVAPTSTGADASSTAVSEPSEATTSGGETDGAATTRGEDTGSSTSDPGGETGDETTSGSPGTGGDEDPVDPVDPVIPGPKVKIMTFNIRVGTAADGPDAWDKRKGLVFQVFKDQDADFIGVQEALGFQLNAIDKAAPAYDRIGVGTKDGKSSGPFNAIYYRKSRFSVKQSRTFWLSNEPDEPGSQTWGNKFPRAVTWGRFLEKDTGYTLYVYNTHFDHVSQNSREKSAVLLAKEIAGRQAQKDPFVVTGDLNAGEGNLAIKFLKGDAKIDGKTNAVPMRDSFRVVKPDANNVGTAHGFNGGTGGNKIDYVFVPPKQKVNSAHIDHFNVDGRYPSDHFPVVGVITFADKQ